MLQSSKKEQANQVSISVNPLQFIVNLLVLIQKNWFFPAFLPIFVLYSEPVVKNLQKCQSRFNFQI
jgi:hypothetical protein